MFNELYMHVASDPDWLYDVLGPLIKYDSFIAALWDIYERVREAGAVQDVVCGVFRSDYMLHQTRSHTNESPTVELKQVEINTFSAAGFCHAERIAEMHRCLGRQVRGLGPEDILRKFPENKNTESIVKLLEAAHNTYMANTCTAGYNRRTCILMAVQPYNFNIADERPIQCGLWEANIPCYRCEWPALLNITTLSENRRLDYRPPVGVEELEVSVIYYRAGYEAEEYNEQGKKTRLQLEMSRAIKCPDVLTHMTIMKSVQQALTQPGALERFLHSTNKYENVRKTFMPMQVLDSSPQGLEARKSAQDALQVVDYVLKPNRDGGGHNIYRADIPAFLSTKSVETWHNFILMQLIEPPKTTGTVMTLEELYIGDVISELGILGTCLWRRSNGEVGGYGVEVVSNEAGGWTFKTKPEDIDEMSVVKGYGCFDCPLLVE